MNGEHASRRRLVWTTATALVLGTALLSACGGSDDGSARDTSTSAAPTSTVAAGTEAAPGSDARGGSAGGTTGAGPGGTSGAREGSADAGGGAGGANAEAAAKPELALRIGLLDECVRPGGQQTITVSTEPGISVGFSAKYADGKTGMDPGYYGGTGAGKTDAEGHYESTWQVAPTAPPGQVTVTVMAAHPSYKTTRREVTFKVSDAAGKCS